jgi:hypothetical protein
LIKLKTTYSFYITCSRNLIIFKNNNKFSVIKLYNSTYLFYIQKLKYDDCRVTGFLFKVMWPHSVRIKYYIKKYKC